jgi:hypothetical protein
MIIFRYIIGILLACFGVYIIICNYIRQIRNYINKKKGIDKWSSPAPFLGPLCVTIGYAITPLAFKPIIFLAFIVDPDTAIIIISLPWFFRELFSSKKDTGGK